MIISRMVRGLLLLLGLCVVATAAGAEPDKPSQRVKEHFAAGLAHVDDPMGPKYEEAYREFHAAFDESHSYRIAANIALCAFYLERDAEALEMYALYLSKATDKDLPKKRREQIERDVQSLRVGLVHLSLQITPANAKLVDERFASDGKKVVNRYPIDGGLAKFGIHPGTHRLTIVADGYEPQTWEIDAQPGSSHDREVHLESVDAKTATQPTAVAPATTNEVRPAPSTPLTKPEARRETSPLVYVGAVATGLFAAGAIGTGILATSKKSDFEAVNNGADVARAKTLHQDMRTFALVSDICLGASVLGAGATVYLYFSGKSGAAVSRDSKTSWGVTPNFTTTQASMELSRNF